MGDRPVEGMVEPRPPKRRGCLFWGCLVAVLLVVAMGGCIGIGIYVLRDRLTSPEPQPIPTYNTKPGEYEAVKGRLTGFAQAAKESRPARIELTADDLNALIADDPELKKLSGKVFVRIEGQEVVLDLSIPLDEAPVPFMKGRWLNATVGLEVSLASGHLIVTPVRATIKGEPVAEKYLKNLQPMDLLRNVKDEEFREFVRQAKSLEVQDGKIVISR